MVTLGRTRIAPGSPETPGRFTSDPVLRELERILTGKPGQSEEATKGFINLLHTHALLVTI